MRKAIRITVFVILAIFFLGFGSLLIYSSNSYEALEEMNETIDLQNYDQVTVTNSEEAIYFIVDNPTANIIFVPGGLVEPDSYSYLAIEIANNGYNVTIAKVAFNLAILTPNKSKDFIDDSLNNYIIGHSLGGVTASIVANQSESISKVILLGSYPIRDISDKDTLIITAEFDIAMNQESFLDSLENVNSNNIIYEISGGNHAQFGWYGAQKGDGTAKIDTLTQQNIIIKEILDFIEEE